MKYALDMVRGNLSSSLYSHTAMWAYLRANQLKHVGIDVQCLSGDSKADWSEFDAVYLYHTMDFRPDEPLALNLFGGTTEGNAKPFERLSQHPNVKLISLDYPMPNYGMRCKNRCKDGKDDYWNKVNWQAVQDHCNFSTDWVLDPGVRFTKPFMGFSRDEWTRQAEGIHHIHRKLTMGDSHAPSVYKPKSLVLRKDGRTLAGVLKKGLRKEAIDAGFDWDQVDEVTCYYGNIDIRHHVCRQGPTIADTLSYVKQLVHAYGMELQKYPEKKFELCYLLPVEDESRKLPATGYYEKTPFYGARYARQEAVKCFNDELYNLSIRYGYKLHKWPVDWYQMDGIEFMEEYMERPRSVHLARKHYRWDLVADMPNREKQSKNLLEF